jgi:methanethiol S-methyltransferase
MTGPALRASFRVRAFAWSGALLFVASLNYFLYAYGRRFGDVVATGDVWTPVAINVLLFSAFALHHSILARTPLRAWVNARLGAASERAAYVWIASVLFAATCAFWRPVPGVLWRADGAAQLAMYAFQIAGLWLTAWAAARIDVFELAGIRQAEGTTRDAVFREEGPYGWVRHPIYTGWLLIVFGTPLMTGTRLSFAVISTIYLLVAMPLEERTLARSAPAYRAYLDKVRWRIVPGLY